MSFSDGLKIVAALVGIFSVLLGIVVRLTQYFVAKEIKSAINGSITKLEKELGEKLDGVKTDGQSRTEKMHALDAVLREDRASFVAKLAGMEKELASLGGEMMRVRDHMHQLVESVAPVQNLTRQLAVLPDQMLNLQTQFFDKLERAGKTDSTR